MSCSSFIYKHLYRPLVVRSVVEKSFGARHIDGGNHDEFRRQSTDRRCSA